MYFFIESLEATPDTSTYELIVEITLQGEPVINVINVHKLDFGVNIDGSGVWSSEFDMTLVRGEYAALVCYTARSLLVNDLHRLSPI